MPEIVYRIVHADPEQWVWDSLGSFLEVGRFTFFFLLLLHLVYSLAFILTSWLLLQIGHQLIANIVVMKNAKKEAALAKEGRQAEATRLKEKVTEVTSLQEVL